MPTGKKLRALNTETDETQPAREAEETTAEEPSAAEEVTTSAAEAPTTAEEPTTAAVEDAPAKRGRRWGLLRRRKNQPEAPAPEATETDEVEATEEVTAGAPPTEDTVGAATESTDETPETAEAVEPAQGEAAEAEPVLVPHRPAGKRLKIAAAAAAVLFVAGGAFLGATAQPVIANRALVETKLDIARTAASAITTLWSYTPENMDSLAERSARYLTGDFAFQYRKFIDSIVATNKQAQVTNATSVLGSAVESVNQSEAAAVVYTNSVATSPVSKNIPSLRYLSYRLEMKRDGSDWRITRMTTITTLDLTPQL